MRTLLANRVVRRHGAWLSTLVPAALLVVLIFLLAYRPAGSVEPLLPVTGEQSRTLHQGWSYRWGDTAWTADGRATWSLEPAESPDWTPMVFPQWLGDGRDGRRVVWERVRLPDLPDDSQQLLVEGVWQLFEVYEDGRRIYHYGSLDREGHAGSFPGSTWHMLPLTRADSGKVLAFRIYSDDQYIGLFQGVRLGRADEHFASMLRGEMPQFLLAAVFILLGIASIVVYSRRLVERATVFYGFFSLSIGIYELSRFETKQLLLNAPHLWSTCEMTSLYLVPMTWCLFAEHMLGAGPFRILRRLWQFYALFLVTAHVLAATTSLTLFAPLHVFIYTFITLVPLSLVCVGHAAWQGNKDARLILLGAIVAASGAIHDMMRQLNVLPYDPEVNHFGMCFLVLCLAWVALRRYLGALEVQRNLELASAVQNLLLPQERSGRVGSYAYATFYDSHDQLSGDWLNVWGKDGELRLIFGDVLGKGPRAALAVAAIAAFIEDSKKGGESLEECIAKVNSGLAKLFAGEMTTTLTAARLGADGEVELFNCGGVGWVRVGVEGAEFIPMPSTPLGLAGGTPLIARRTLTTGRGEMLLAFSDGVLEGSRALAKLTEVLRRDDGQLPDFEALFAGALRTGLPTNRGDDRSMVALQRLASGQVIRVDPPGDAQAS